MLLCFGSAAAEVQGGPTSNAVLPLPAPSKMADLDAKNWQLLGSPDARLVLIRVIASKDNSGLPFAIVDKVHARIYLFDAKGIPRGSAPALLGAQAGDQSTPGVGARPLSEIKTFERTTPAGRFSSEPGVNAAGDRVVWFDYNEGLAIHRARPGKTFKKRLSLLARNEPQSSKDSWGCIVVPPEFYDTRIAPLLGRAPASVVYVLPETRSLSAAFAVARPLAASERDVPVRFVADKFL